jgi:hypothetical protein
MYQNDWMLARLAAERQRDLVRQLEHDRLVRQAELAIHSQRHTMYHMLAWTGRQLVRWGERLQAPHARHHQRAQPHPWGV